MIMSQKNLIIILLFFFTVSAVFLFWQNDRELDPDQGKSWWTLAFASPQEPENLSFIVENHSDQETFEYEIMADKTLVTKDSFVVKRGEKATITPILTAKASERTKITVTLGTEKKEIYR